jgi:hypothetical protein
MRCAFLSVLVTALVAAPALGATLDPGMLVLAAGWNLGPDTVVGLARKQQRRIAAALR